MQTDKIKFHTQTPYPWMNELSVQYEYDLVERHWLRQSKRGDTRSRLLVFAANLTEEAQSTDQTTPGLFLPETRLRHHSSIPNQTLQIHTWRPARALFAETVLFANNDWHVHARALLES